MAVALMTRGPLTAYSIFLMQGFMLSRVTVAGAAIFSEVDEKLRQVDKTFCLKPSILRQPLKHWYFKGEPESETVMYTKVVMSLI